MGMGASEQKKIHVVFLFGKDEETKRTENIPLGLDILDRTVKSLSHLARRVKNHRFPQDLMWVDEF